MKKQNQKEYLTLTEYAKRVGQKLDKNKIKELEQLVFFASQKGFELPIAFNIEVLDNIDLENGAFF